MKIFDFPSTWSGLAREDNPQRDNFSSMVLALYREDEITFYADGAYNLTPKAIVEIQNHIAPLSIFNFKFEETLIFKVIKAEHESLAYELANNERMVSLIEVKKPEQLKSAIFNHIQKSYRTH